MIPEESKVAAIRGFMELEDRMLLAMISADLTRIAKALEENNKQTMITQEALIAILKELRSV